MALDDQILITMLDSIKDIDLTQDPENVRSQMVALFVQGIKDYIKSGDVITSTGTYKVT